MGGRAWAPGKTGTRVPRGPLEIKKYVLNNNDMQVDGAAGYRQVKVLEFFNCPGPRQGVEDIRELLHKVELQGAQGGRKVEVFQVSNDDTAVAQRRLEDKQPEEKTNTDCLVKEQEKEYQTRWKIKTGNVLDFFNQRSTQQCTPPNIWVAEDTTMSTYLVNRSSLSAIGFIKPIDMLGIFGWLASIKKGRLEPVKVKCIIRVYHKTIVGNKLCRLDDVTSKVVLYRNMGFNESGIQENFYWFWCREQHLACGLFGYREDINEAAFAVVVVEKIYAHELSTFNNTVACEAEIGSTKSFLKREFDMKDLEEAKKILGMKIVRDRSRKILRVSQSGYISKILNNFRIDNGKSVQMPMGGHFKLSLKDCPIRDCAVERMTYLQVFVDFDYAMGRSIKMYEFMILGCAGSLKANLQHMEALSTTEAGYMTFTEAWKKKMWLKGLLTESRYELRLVAGIATGALVKGGSRSEVPTQVKVAAYCMNNLDSRKLVDFIKLPMKICLIEGYEVCTVSVTIGKSYKVEVLIIVDDIDECHILLGRPLQCELAKPDVKVKEKVAMVPPKVTLQLPKLEVKVEEKIVMVPPKVTPQLPKLEVKVEEKIVKSEVFEDHIEKIKNLQSYKQHDDNISPLSFGTTNKVGEAAAGLLEAALGAAELEGAAVGAAEAEEAAAAEAVAAEAATLESEEGLEATVKAEAEAVEAAEESAGLGARLGARLGSALGRTIETGINKALKVLQVLKANAGNLLLLFGAIQLIPTAYRKVIAGWLMNLANMGIKLVLVAYDFNGSSGSEEGKKVAKSAQEVVNGLHETARKLTVDSPSKVPINKEMHETVMKKIKQNLESDKQEMEKMTNILGEMDTIMKKHVDNHSHDGQQNHVTS
uniref:Reverse transcriptase Ty1/copia-type domain-containing protein n=1 Tax=Tanacetum cinerariifolium TaxID=118510 RepID=A0A6L2P8E5_TANCI|nr:hypothetical protein [Tanacetum cinerariifolium]